MSAVAPGTAVPTFVDHQVIQRHRDADHATLVSDNPALQGAEVVDESGQLVARAAASPDRGGVAADIPVGGPYSVRGVDGTVLAHDVLVGDIWVLAGQSNMQGTARMVDVEPPSPVVGLLDMTRRWRAAVEPLHQLSLSPDPVHHGMDDEERAGLRAFDAAGLLGAGLGLAFGRAYHARTGVPVGLVATAHGGTTLAQWSPGLVDRRGESLYASFLRSIAAAGNNVAGVLWYQGESDAEPATPFTFATDLRHLVESMRRDLGDTALPFHHVQLGRFIADVDASHHQRWSAVREAQRLFPATGMASAIDLDLDDFIHLSTSASRRLGVRLARLASGEAGGPRLRGIALSDDAMSATVAFDGVTGALQSDGHVSGFSLHDADVRARAAVTHAAVSGDGDALRVEFTRAIEPGDHLAYGYGLDPVARLRDAADMSAPAFGPLPLTG